MIINKVILEFVCVQFDLWRIHELLEVAWRRGGDVLLGTFWCDLIGVIYGYLSKGSFVRGVLQVDGIRREKKPMRSKLSRHILFSA